MGFIERLREERGKDKGKQDPISQRLDADSQKRMQLHEKHRQLVEEAEKAYADSGIDFLLSGLREVISAGIVDVGHSMNYRTQRGIRPKSNESVLKIMFLGGKGNRDDFFAVEMTPDGTVHFHAGWLGSSKVSRNSWQNNKEILECSLERAYRHPKRFETTPSDEHYWR